MKIKVRLDTKKDIIKFVEISEKSGENVLLKDDEGHCVSAKSLIGALYTMEWKSVYCVCDKDISTLFLKFIF